MTPKYEFCTSDPYIIDSGYPKRIRATRDIPRWGIKKGDRGGNICRYENLSHDGNCWVWGDSEIKALGRISGNARVFGKSIVSGVSNVTGDSVIRDSQIYGHATISDDAVITSSYIGECVKVFGNSKVSNLSIQGDVRIFGYSEVKGNNKPTLLGNLIICGWTKIVFNVDSTIHDLTLCHSYEDRLKVIKRGEVKKLFTKILS